MVIWGRIESVDGNPLRPPIPFFLALKGDSPINQKPTFSDIARYLLVYVCLVALAFPALWALMQLVTNFSFYWRVSGGSVPLHHVGYYFISFLFAVAWVVGILVTETSFRTSIDEVRIRRARTSPSPALSQQSPNKVMGWLRQIGLDVFAPRLLKATSVVVGLFLLGLLIDRLFYYLLLG